MKPRMVITMNGGIIQYVSSDIDIDILLIDYDIDDTDDDYIKIVNGTEAFVTIFKPDDVNSKIVDKVWHIKEAL